MDYREARKLLAQQPARRRPSRASDHFSDRSSSTTPSTAPPRSKTDAEKLLEKSARQRHETELGRMLELAGLRPETQYRFHPTRKWALDFAWPDEKVGVEIDGALGSGKHSRRKGQLNDMEKRNAAQLLGWIVLTFGRQHIDSGAALDQISRALVSRR